MPLEPVCREAHSRILAGVCPWCRRTISSGHVVWELGRATEHLNDGSHRSNAESSFALTVRDHRAELPRLRAMLNDRSENSQEAATSHLVIFGNKLDLWEAEQLERHVGSGPENLWLRIVLIGCYQFKRQPETARSKLRGHIAWIIQNMPKSSIAGTLGLFCVSEFEEQGEFYDEVKRLWIGVLTANPENVKF